MSDDTIEQELATLATAAPAGLAERVFAGWLRAPSRLGEVFVAFTGDGVQFVRSAESAGDPDGFARAYRDRFGIPLIVCVRDAHDRAGILRDGQRRLDNSAAQEHAAALIEIAKVANHRFADLVAEANPIHSARTRSLGGGGR